MKGENNAFLIYQDDNGVSNVNVRFEGEDVWLTAEQLQQLFQASQQDVSHHIQQIYADGELLAEATNKKYLLVRVGDKQYGRQTIHSCLNMPTKLTKAFAEFIDGRCIGGSQKRLKKLLSADLTAEKD